MVLGSLDQLDVIRLPLYALWRKWLRWRYGVTIHPSSRISLSGRIVSGGPGSVVIARDTAVSFKTLLIARDERGMLRPIYIGERCLVGGGALILPGVTIGDGSVIAAGAVVFDHVPPGCIAAGNPARVLRSGIETERFGRIKGIVGNEGRVPPFAPALPRIEPRKNRPL